MGATARDDGAGSLDLLSSADAGTINYAGQSLLIIPDQTIQWPVPRYSKELMGSEEADDGGTILTYRWVLDGYEYKDTLVRFPADGNVTVRYRPAAGDATANETYTVQSLALDLTKDYAETITPGSARWKVGGHAYQHIVSAGVYRDIDPDTGVGSLAGTLDLATGRVNITDWIGGGANAVTLDALTTQVGGQPVDEVTFRTPASPIRPGSLQLRWEDLAGASYSKTPDSSGVLQDGDCEITIDFYRGQVRVHFGRWRAVSGLTAEELAASWYDTGSIVDIGGVASIWQPYPILAETLIYNAIAQTTLPPDSSLLGLDAARLPVDGKAQIYRTGMLALIHHTASIAKSTLLAGEVIDCGRPRLYRAIIEDADGLRLPCDTLYTVDREAGTVTMADPLDLAGYTAPYTLYHTVADLQRLRDVDIAGRLTCLRPLSHDMPADGNAYASGVLYIGTLQAKVSDVFEQTTWTGEWSDTRIGDQPLASYNAALYPIAVTNAGAYPDRFLVKFKTSTTYDVIGEQLGFVGSGDINTDFAPVNQLTGAIYFTIDYRGWGGSWSAGNCLRFNVAGACWPVDAVRAVQPSDPSEDSDSVELLLIGNVDA